MNGLIAALACLVLAAVTLAVVPVARRRRLGNRALKIIGFSALAGFIALNLSDWPVGWLTAFWTDHSIVGATIDTLLLGAVLYLSYKAADLRLQNDLDTHIAMAGRAGVVDSLVEIEVALALACTSRAKVYELWPEWSGKDWCEPGEALAWLRQHRKIIETASGRLTERDPRGWPLPATLSLEEWRRNLVDECIRRLMATIRDWSVVLTRSRDGQLDLVKVGDLRLQLIKIDDHLEFGRAAEAVAAIEKCRRTCRQLAFSFEVGSKPNSFRPEVVDIRRESRPIFLAGSDQSRPTSGLFARLPRWLGGRAAA